MIPSHPGHFLVRSVFTDSVTAEELSLMLNINPCDLSHILGGLSPVTQELAEAVEAHYGLKKDTLLKMQKRYDDYMKNSGGLNQ